MLTIDLNADMGEGMDNDASLVSWISSANIACGGHAGDKGSMKKTVELAISHHVAIGAHPSYPDRENFGRTDLLGTTVSMNDIHSIIVEQVQSLVEVCNEFNVRVTHVKPHGALYNRSARDPDLALAILEAIKACDDNLLVYGLSGSIMADMANRAGMKFVHEVFADRTYQPDGTLTPRTSADALITDHQQSLQQVLQMLKENRVRSVDGRLIPIKAESVCIHGDGVHAVEFASAIRRLLESEGIQIKSPSQ